MSSNLKDNFSKLPAVGKESISGGRRAVLYCNQDNQVVSDNEYDIHNGFSKTNSEVLRASSTTDTLVSQGIKIVQHSPNRQLDEMVEVSSREVNPTSISSVSFETDFNSSSEAPIAAAILTNDRSSNPSVMNSQPRVENRSGNRCSCCNRPLAVCFIVLIFVVIMVIASAKKLLHQIGTTSPNIKTAIEGSFPFLRTEGRCFSLCEPDDILFSENKLMKPVIAHDGIKPTRYFLYLFPPEPEFGPEVGEPVYLTDYLEKGQVELAREKAEVKGLEWKNLISYAGFLTISRKYDSHLYFWFFPSQSDPTKDPVILWLQGGPGATSMFGLFKENGPIHATLDKNKKPKAELNRFSWNRNSSVLYIDNPVGTGFSYTNSFKGYPQFVNISSNQLFNALQQFFIIFYEYQERDFYIFGESYGGKYIPALSHRILQAKEDPENYGGAIDINLVGIGIGNGWISPIDQGKYANYLFYHGLIDEEQYMTLIHLEEDLLEKIEDGRYVDSWMSSDNQLNFILQALNFSSLYDITNGQYNPDTMNFWYYMQQPYVRKAMNLGNRTMSDGLSIYKAMIEDTMMSAREDFVEAMENLKVLLYHGSLDIICHFPGAQEMLARTNWTTKDEYHSSERRAVWFFNEDTKQKELAGYVKGDGSPKLMMIRNAGHCSPMDQPQWTLRMLESFIDGSL